MKIALLGYGNMGREIEKVITKRGLHQIVAICLKTSGDSLNENQISHADVVIDFTAPGVVIENIRKIARLKKNLVVGTTGWYTQMDTVKKIISDTGTGLIYAQNFSVGAHIFFKLTAYAAELAAKRGQYDVYGLEVHHTGKKDSPSGTALRTAKEIIDHFPAKKTTQYGPLDRKINPDELHFASIRAGRNPGFHQVVFDSEADSISLSESAHNRQGFAEGAILAAEFIKDKKGVHVFEEIM